MKEATGELNMTVVTVVAIAAVGAFFYIFIWPGIQQGMATNTCKNSCPAPETGQQNAYAKKNGKDWTCYCPDGKPLVK